MEVYPESKKLRIFDLRLGGVYEQWMPISEVIPVTKYDYHSSHSLYFFKPATFLDFDMVYANYISKAMLVFDKYGTWNDEGVYSEALNLENTYNETLWYDEFNVNKLP